MRRDVGNHCLFFKLRHLCEVVFVIHEAKRPTEYMLQLGMRAVPFSCRTLYVQDISNSQQTISNTTNSNIIYISTNIYNPNKTT